MKSFKKYVKESSLTNQALDTDTGMSAGDITNADTLRKLQRLLT